MATFTYVPSYNSREHVKPRVNTSQFGDGYEQRSGDGINTQMRTWKLVFDNQSTAQRDGIIAFFEARGAVESFDWTPPAGSPGKFVCREWDDVASGYNSWNISADFEEVPM